MKDEYDALIENKMWNLAPRLLNANIIKSLKIFRHNNKSDGSFERCKARLISDGAIQQNDINYGETFSPVVKPNIIQTVVGVNIWVSLTTSPIIPYLSTVEVII